MKNNSTLHFYSYDCVLNPWLAGGGAYRDLEILSILKEKIGRVKLYVGGFPGMKTQVLKGIEIIPIGFGTNEIISRITFVINANWKILFHKKEPIGITLSLYSPFITSYFHRKRMYGVLHHIIGKNWTKKTKFFGNFLCFLENSYYTIPDNFVVLNDSIALSLLDRKPNANIFRTSNGYDPELLKLKDSSETSTPFLLFIGRLDIFMKGLDLLVEAFGIIIKNYPELNLILAGRGDPESEKKILSVIQKFGLEQNVTIRKNISEGEKFDLLSKCLIFCSPSRFEGWGIAAVEANAAGKPVVVSEASGFKNSIANGYSGVRVEFGEAKIFADEIVRLLANPKQTKRMGLQAREWARQFSWDSIAESELLWLGNCVLDREQFN